MAKKNDMVIAGTECVGCKYLKEVDNNHIYCGYKEKKYVYGQYIPCDGIVK